MRKLFVTSLILAAVVLSVLVLMHPGVAQAGSTAPSHLLAATATPVAAAPNKLPPTGSAQSDSSTLLLFGIGGLLLMVGLVIRSRRRTIA